mmetsp:Transcript_12797/g.38587  ORF Transcript_12797/g.38587 Transcript_12797/m.38587 type:complete len:241 (+) Transcript_12797:1407-2129(+)
MARVPSRLYTFTRTASNVSAFWAIFHSRDSSSLDTPPDAARRDSTRATRSAYWRWCRLARSNPSSTLLSRSHDIVLWSNWSCSSPFSASTWRSMESTSLSADSWRANSPFCTSSSMKLRCTWATSLAQGCEVPSSAAGALSMIEYKCPKRLEVAPEPFLSLASGTLSLRRWSRVASKKVLSQFITTRHRSGRRKSIAAAATPRAASSRATDGVRCVVRRPSSAPMPPVATKSSTRYACHR